MTYDDVACLQFSSSSSNVRISRRDRRFSESFQVVNASIKVIRVGILAFQSISYNFAFCATPTLCKRILASLMSLHNCILSYGVVNFALYLTLVLITITYSSDVHEKEWFTVFQKSPPPQKCLKNFSHTHDSFQFLLIFRKFENVRQQLCQFY